MFLESEAEYFSVFSIFLREDYVYNYVCVRLSFGMLFRNFNDVVREGDGVRILRCWKFLFLIYKVNKYYKYVFVVLYFIVKIIFLFIF